MDSRNNKVRKVTMPALIATEAMAMILTRDPETIRTMEIAQELATSTISQKMLTAISR